MATSITRSRSRLTELALVAVLIGACGGEADPLLDEAAIDEIRSEYEALDGYTNEELVTVAEGLCSGLEDGELSLDFFGLIDDSWAEVGTTETQFEERLASFDLVTAACPVELTPELAADSEPIPMSFTLLGDEGDEYEYSVLSGCEGQGGYRDVKTDMIFNLTDEQGNVLGVARLEDSDDSALGCTVSGTFTMTFGELDDDELYFVGDRAGKRGELAYTGLELKENGTIQLSLG